MSTHFWSVARAGMLAVLAVLGGSGRAAAQGTASATPLGLRVFEQDLVDVIAKSEGAVVAIARVLPGDEQVDNLPRDPFGFRPPSVPGDVSFIPREFFSGVILAREPDDGIRYVLTPRHVLTGSRQRPAKRPEDAQFFVKLASRHVVQGVLYNQDEHSDLAVLKLDLESVGLAAAQVPTFQFGEAEKLRKGNVVVGLGNPYAIARDGSASASLGLISNISRRSSEGESRPNAGDESGIIFEYGALLHVDLRLQLGTSGAAIVNTEGQLVGLGTSLAALRGYESSVGFAVPFDVEVRRIVKSLLEGNEVEYGFLGVMPVDATLSGQRDREGQWLPVSAARLSGIGQQSPADQAGLKQGDCILAVNGQPISGSSELMLKIGMLGPDASPRLDIWRPSRGERMETVVRLGKWPVYDDRSIIAPHPRHPAWRGLTVDYVTARRRFMPTNPLGRYHRAVVVTRVEEGERASPHGLQMGDFITHVDGVPVQTPSEFAVAVQGKTEAVEFNLADGRRVTVAP